MAIHNRYTDEQIEYVRKIAPGRYNQEIADLFNAEFGTSVTESQMKSFKANHKIKSNLPRQRRTDNARLFTEEQESFIREHAPGMHNKRLTELINSKFGLNIEIKQLKAWKKNHKVSSGLKGSEGVSPPNKGTKGLYNVGGNSTSFKKGHLPKNYKPVGTERIDRDGYTLIKVQDDGPWHKRWKHKHRVIWEEANGPIPKGHVLIFADQDKRNICLGNLILMKQNLLSTLNKKGLLYNDADLTKTGIIVAGLHQMISERNGRLVNRWNINSTL